MNWLEITVTVDAEAAEAVVETLSRYTPDGVAIEQRAREIEPGADWSPDGPLEPTVSVRAYLPMDAEIESQRRQIEQALWHLRQIVPFPEPTISEIKPEDWENAWKEHYHVLRVGSRFVIKPSWREHVSVPGDVVIELDPGMAFGTGLHPTTQMCLSAIEQYMRAGAQAIDLGTGSGILAIAAAKLGAASVLALDVDPIAVEAARENVRRNQVEGVVSVEAGSLNAARQTLATPRTEWGPRLSSRRRCRLRSGQAPPHLELNRGRVSVRGAGVDFALVNILAKTIIQLCDEGLAEIIDPGGLAVFAGLIDTQEDEVRETLARIELSVIDRMQDKDWIGLVCRREAVRH